MRLTPQAEMEYREAGLPDIQGTFCGFDLDADTGFDWSKAFRVIGHRPGGGGQKYGEAVTEFRASYSCDVFGRSATVQPESAFVNYFIRAK